MCKRKLILMVMLVIMPLCGCQMFQGDPKAQYVASLNLYSSTCDILATYKAQGKFTDEQNVVILAAAEEGRKILREWRISIDAGQEYRPDLLMSFTTILQKMAEYQSKGGK